MWWKNVLFDLFLLNILEFIIFWIYLKKMTKVNENDPLFAEVIYYLEKDSINIELNETISRASKDIWEFFNDNK